MKHYEELATYQRDGFEIIVDKTWEDLDVGDCFDDTCWDIQYLRDQIDSYDLEWFMLRVRVLLDGHELGRDTLGGCLYDWDRVNDVLTDGTAEDCIEEAMQQARAEARRLSESLQRVINTEPA